ncbi:MAG: hypothetical protein Q8M16_07380 [Pirellulaceae bacterium]|nr:hypothetical protein [Pirellulaceae bacterium]
MAINVHPKRDETAVYELVEGTFDNSASDSGWIIHEEVGGNNVWLFSIE